MRWRLLALAALTAGPAAADTVYDMCVRPGSYGPEQCDCVSAEMRRALSPGDHALFSAVAKRYLSRLDEGLGKAGAWDAAVQSEAMARNVGYPGLQAQTDELARRHKEIVDRCGGN